jgi:hypothetical protein
MFDPASWRAVWVTAASALSRVVGAAWGLFHRPRLEIVYVVVVICGPWPR